MNYTGIYEPYIKKLSACLTRDTAMREDVAQEMRLELIKSGHTEDTEFQASVLWIAKNRAIDYLRKFFKGQIPFGSMEDIDNLIYKHKEE